MQRTSLVPGKNRVPGPRLLMLRYTWVLHAVPVGLTSVSARAGFSERPHERKRGSLRGKVPLSSPVWEAAVLSGVSGSVVVVGIRPLDAPNRSAL